MAATERKLQLVDESNNVWKYLFAPSSPQQEATWFTVSTCGRGRFDCALDGLRELLDLGPTLTAAMSDKLRRMTANAKFKRRVAALGEAEARRLLLPDFGRLYNQNANDGRDHSLDSNDLVNLCLDAFHVIPILIIGDFPTAGLQQLDFQEGLQNRAELRSFFLAEEDYEPDLVRLRATEAARRRCKYIFFWRSAYLDDTGRRHATWVTLQAKVPSGEFRKVFFEDELPPHLLTAFLNTQAVHQRAFRPAVPESKEEQEEEDAQSRFVRMLSENVPLPGQSLGQSPLNLGEPLSPFELELPP